MILLTFFIFILVVSDGYLIGLGDHTLCFLRDTELSKLGDDFFFFCLDMK